jgi:hypothetical protein
MDKWNQLSESDYNRAWDRFYKVFDFRPSIKPEDWPGIREPAPSVTYSISHIYGNPEYAALESDLQVSARAAFQACARHDEAMYALDWHHPGYLFQPHALAESDFWPVPALPNGDYYIFLATDFRFGWFGHPWERTICIFGSPLLSAIDRRRPRLFTYQVRAQV